MILRPQNCALGYETRVCPHTSVHLNNSHILVFTTILFQYASQWPLDGYHFVVTEKHNIISNVLVSLKPFVTLPQNWQCIYKTMQCIQKSQTSGSAINGGKR